MRFFMAVLPFLALGCAGGELRELERLLAEEYAEPPTHAPDRRDPFVAYVDEAVRTHPRVTEALARAEAALARARGAGALEDPMLFFKTEEVPIRTPGALNQSEFNAAGLSQSLPLFKQGLREDVAVAEAHRALEASRRAALDVASDVRKAAAEHRAAVREREIHEKHLEIMKMFVAVTETKYATGKVSQQDVLESQSGTTMLQVSVAEAESRLDQARAALRELTGRDAPPPPAPRPAARSLAELEGAVLERHPSVRGARESVRRAEAALALARRERWAPDVSAEVMVMQMPGEPDAWGGTLGFTLPWFSPKRRAEVDAAGRELEAEKRALEAASRSVRRELAAAHARLASALRTLDLVENDLLPRARQTLEVARSNYEKEKIDFLRFLQAEQELRSVETEQARALAQAETAGAELDRAAGTLPGGKP